jgi:Domain of unknown function (DUF5625)
MWITGLCVFWPPLPPTEISIQDTGLILNKEFNAPVDKSYLLLLRFTFPSNEARLKDELVGAWRTSSFCTSNIEYDAIPQRERSSLGLPIPFRIVVRTNPAGTPLVEQTFHSLCTSGHNLSDGKYRDVGRIELKEGAYRIEVYNLQPQPAFRGVKVQMSLVSGMVK